MIKDKKERDIFEKACIISFQRVARLLTASFTQLEYIQYSMPGFSIDDFRYALGKTFNEMKELAGLKANKPKRRSGPEKKKVIQNGAEIRLCNKCGKEYASNDLNRLVCPRCKAENFKVSD